MGAYAIKPGFKVIGLLLIVISNPALADRLSRLLSGRYLLLYSHKYYYSRKEISH
jgi:hypothetical protein